MKTNRFILYILCFNIFSILYCNDVIAQKPENRIQKIIDTAIDNFDNERSKDAEILFKRAILLSKEKNDQNRLAKSYFWLGYLYHNKSNLQEAKNNYLCALSLHKYKDLDCDKDIALLNRNMGSILRREGEYVKSVDYFIKSIEISKRINYYSNLSLSYNGLADVYRRIELYKKSLDVHKKALSINIKQDDKTKIGITYNGIGNLYEDLFKLDTALIYFKKSLKIHSKNNSKYHIAICDNNIGRIYLLQNKLGQAESYFKKALKYFDNTNISEEAIIFKNNLIRLYIKQKNFKKAKTLIESTRKLAIEIEAREPLYANYELSYLLNTMLGDNRNALIYYNKFLDLRDSVSGVIPKSKIEAIKAEYNTIMMKEKLRAAAEKEEQRNVFVIIMIALLVAFATILFFLVRSLNQNKLLKEYARIEESLE